MIIGDAEEDGIREIDTKCVNCGDISISIDVDLDPNEKCCFCGARELEEYSG